MESIVSVVRQRDERSAAEIAAVWSDDRGEDTLHCV